MNNDYYERKLQDSKDRMNELIKDSAGLEGDEFKSAEKKINCTQLDINNYTRAIK